MTSPPRNVTLEIAALFVLSALLALLAVVIVLVCADLVQGRRPNWVALTQADNLQLVLVLGFGLALTSVIWYVQRGYNQPFRYWDGVIWGLFCFALTATLVLIPQLWSATRDNPLGLWGTLATVYLVGGAFALPAIFTIAPLALWSWHRIVIALR